MKCLALSLGHRQGDSIRTLLTFKTTNHNLNLTLTKHLTLNPNLKDAFRDLKHMQIRNIVYELEIVIYRPKVCGHLPVKHLIPKSWALIWSRSPSAAITASTLLGRLSTRCWNIALGTCFHSATRALVRLGTDVG
jgi:hypothetical protein